MADPSFLSHLFRATELLSDGKTELAHAAVVRALVLEPMDIRARDLLAATMFRLERYDEAIGVYRALIDELPSETSFRLNLAIVHLKRGENGEARKVLEEVVELDSAHARAWGYLGITYERLGELKLAETAFLRGGHDALAKNIAKGSDEGPKKGTLPGNAALSALQAAFDDPDTMGNRTRPGGLAVGTGAGYAPRLTSPPAPDAAVARIRSMSSEPPPSLDTDVRNLRELASDTNLSTPSGEPLQRVGHDWLLHIGEKSSFYVRAESVRAMHGKLQNIVGRRKPRGGETEEVLGGAFGALVQLQGVGTLVLTPRYSHRFVAVNVGEEPFFVREEALACFDAKLSYESGRLQKLDDSLAHLVQMRGVGSALLESPSEVRSLEAGENRGVVIRLSSLLGWSGRLVPHVLAPEDSISGQRGFISLTGRGNVFFATARE